MTRITLAAFLVVSACGYPQPTLNGDGGGSGRDSSILDGTTTDSSSSLTVTVSPTAFVIHPNDTRLATIVVTNSSAQTVGAPTFAATGLTLGMMTFLPGTCTTQLMPGASCTAIGHLTGTNAGQIGFAVTATASSGGTGMATLSMTVMPACASTCGPSATANCCLSPVVPGNAPGATLAGASFYRSYDAATDNMYTSMSAPATVSDFRLDTYLITVGRFRAFVNAGMGTQANPPAAGAGAHSAIANSGWQASFDGSLATDQAALVAAVKCNATYQTWTDTAGANESLPMNCITWYEALAFCAWDGGYLATEAEWNYAAAGGSEQRAYPWSSPASSLSIDCSYANYSVGSPPCVASGTNRVGSESPKGDGKWGQADLAGNLYEWTLDWYATSYSTSCNDCANLTTASNRVIRGSFFSNPASTLRTGFRYDVAPSSRAIDLGARCARAP